MISLNLRRRITGLLVAIVIAFSSVGAIDLVPLQASVLPNATAVQVVAGTSHTLVRLSNGDVWAWGSNARGQLGVDNNFSATNSLPVHVPLGGQATYIAAGHNSSYAIVGGQVFAWGDNTTGQLGVPASQTAGGRRSTPMAVPGLPIANQVVAGEGHVLVRSGGQVWAFGRNDMGQLVTNNTAASLPQPALTTGAPNAARTIAAGANHSLFISNTASNELWGAGSNQAFQVARAASTLGVPHYLSWNVTAAHGAMSHGANMVAAGNDFTLELAGGNIFAYGTNNSNGRLGRSASSTAVNANRRSNSGVHLNYHMTATNRSINFIAAGHNHALAINTIGSVFTWGSNSQGQLGIGNTASTSAGNSFSLTQVSGLTTSMASVAGGGNHSLAIGTDGSLWAWGGNASGQLGDGSTTTRTTPVQILRSNGTWVNVSSEWHNFTFDASTGTITGYSGPVNNLVIPSQIGGTNVVRIADRAFEDVGLTGTLTLPSTLTSMGLGAFANNNITTVSIPNSVTNIGAGAFLYNSITNLTFVAGGSSLTIGAEAFRHNTLTTVEVPARVSSVGNLAFANNPNLMTARFMHTDITLLQVQSSGGILGNTDIFSGAPSNLRLYRQAGNVTIAAYHGRQWNIIGTAGGNVGHSNFTFSLVAGAYTITSFVGAVPVNGAIVFPNTGPTGAPVRTIAGTVFQSLVGTPRNNITSIVFEAPSSVNTIAANAFLGLPGLRTAVIPASVQSIGASAFANSTALTEVHFEHPNGYQLRNGQIFANETIFTGIGANLRLTRPVGASASSYVPFVSPVGVTRNWSVSDGNIAWWTISPATGTGPATIVSFNGPNNLATIEIPSVVGGRSIVSIGAHVLNASNAPNLQEVIIPASVTNIAANAISGPNLITARLLHTDGGTIQTIPANAFGDPAVRNANFRIWFQTHATGFSEPVWRGFPSQTDLGGIWESSEWTGQGLIITGFIGGGTTIQIPESIGGRPVRYIGPNVFQNNTELRSLVIPGSVAFISDNAVNNAPNLEMIYLRHTNANIFTYFPTAAFVGVHPNLRIYFPVGATGFTTPTWNNFRAYPQEWAYTVTAGQVTLTGYNGLDTVVEIPSTIQGLPVRAIASETFANNQNITSIVIPATVNTILANAVFNCRYLETVVFEHTNANDITNFASYAFVGVAANFRILFPYGAIGFTTPAWRGYFAAPKTGDSVLRHGNFEYTIRRVTLPGMGNVSHDEVVITRYIGNTAVITVPATIDGMPVAGLGDAAFFQNGFVTQVNLPQSLRTIGNNTFAGATALTSIRIPAAVTEIGNSAFMGASSLTRVSFEHTNGANITIGENAFSNTGAGFHVTFPTGAAGFSTPTWRGVPAVPYGQAPSQGGQNNNQNNQGQPGTARSFPVSTTDTFPGVTGAPLLFREGVGYVSLRAFAILIESNPNTEIRFNVPEAGWATITGRHTDGRTVTLTITSNDPRVVVTHNGVRHDETDLAAWAGPLSGRARYQLRTINEGGNIFLPFRAVSNIFGYDVSMLNSTTVQFTALVDAEG